MQVQRIQIDQQMAQLRIESQRARLTAEHQMRQMDINIERAQMKVHRQEAKVDIDSSGLKNNTGRKDVITLQDTYAKRAIDQAKQGIKEMISDAEFVGQLPNKTGKSLIGELARQKMLDPTPPPTGRSQLPPDPVQFRGNPGDLNIDWTPHSVDITWSDPQLPVFTLDPKGQVFIELAQKASVNFQVVEMTIPAEVGSVVDTSA